MYRAPQLRLPSIDTVRLLLAPALAFIVTGLDRGYQTELWQHLSRGRLIARAGKIVSVDHSTFTVPGQALRDNNWLSQLLYYALHTAGGINLVQLANSLAIAGAVAWLVHLCRRESGSTRIAGALGVVVFLGLWQTLLIRPQSFSMLLFAALYGLLLTANRRPALLALAPPLIALWANVHGGFAVGLMLILTFVAPVAWQRWTQPRPDRPRLTPWAVCLAGAGLATLLNPYGWDVYRYAGRLSSLGVARGIEEWLPPSPATLVGGAFAVSVVGVTFLVVRARQVLTLRDACILCCFLVPACVSVRMTVWWFLAAAPVAARLMAHVAAHAAQRGGRVVEQPSPVPSWRATVAVAGILAVCLGSVPCFERHSPLFGAARTAHRTESDLASLAPVLAEPAVSLDAPAPPVRVFARMEWANFLAWKADGRAKVFVEGHVELYPEHTWSEYLSVSAARPGWQRVLDRHGVGFLVLDPTYHSALLSEVRRSDEWRSRAAAGDVLLFERSTAEAREVRPAVGGAVAGGADF